MTRQPRRMSAMSNYASRPHRKQPDKKDDSSSFNTLDGGGYGKKKTAIVKRWAALFSDHRSDLRPPSRLLLLGYDLVLDLGIRSGRNDFLLRQVGFLRVGTAIDNLLRIGRSDSGQSVELFLGGGIDVEQICAGCARGGCRCRLLVSLRHRNTAQQAQCKKCDENFRQ